MTWVGPLLIVIGTVAAMEAVAWAVHKYIMHGWGWGWHKSPMRASTVGRTCAARPVRSETTL